MDLRKNPKATARGLRNNNPFNLQKTAIGWSGKVAGTDTRFETFDSVENGIRAGIIDIVGDIVKDKTDTLTKLFNKFAPPHENDTAAYVNFVSKITGRAPEANLAPGGKVSADFLAKLAAAIIQKENGIEQAKLIDAATISRGVNLAINSSAIRSYIDKKGYSGPGGANERLNDLSGLIFMALVLLLIIYATIK